MNETTMAVQKQTLEIFRVILLFKHVKKKMYVLLDKLMSNIKLFQLNLEALSRAVIWLAFGIRSSSRLATEGLGTKKDVEIQSKTRLIFIRQ